MADFSRVSQGGDTASMDGPVITADSTCLTFWYMLDVDDTVVFRVVLSDTQDMLFVLEGKL